MIPQQLSLHVYERLASPETLNEVQVLAIVQTAQSLLEHCVRLERLMEGWGERCEGEETAAASLSAV